MDRNIPDNRDKTKYGDGDPEMASFDRMKLIEARLEGPE